MSRFTHLKIFVLFSLVSSSVFGQDELIIKGTVSHNGQGIPLASLYLSPTGHSTQTNQSGQFLLKVDEGGSWLIASAHGYYSDSIKISSTINDYHFNLTPSADLLNEVVISGTLKPLSKSDSPIPIEVYSSQFFKSNPTPSLFEALQNINGVRPQLNCNICNTGDVHINGMEGPYTMVLIDGMPIVSGLSTVYGLFGIPQALIDRIEVVKGPASTLYGSEAVGGLINVITRTPSKAPLFSAEVMGSTWSEWNADVAAKFRTGKNSVALSGINYFNYQNPIDRNGDHFTDVALQHRIAAFQKWQLQRPHKRECLLAARYVYEDRWGGEMNWRREHRGGDSVYGESIYTKRWEIFGTYQLPIKERLYLQVSLNDHQQNSAYGNTSFQARQTIGFVQSYWNKNVDHHELILGTTFRYTSYDDNSAATSMIDSTGQLQTQKNITLLPGIFIQDLWQVHPQHALLIGLRYDRNSVHGNIFTPRWNYKWQSQNKQQTFRAGIGNGYRVVQIFTEDHAALTGDRQVVFAEELLPEKSWNANLNYAQKWFSAEGIITGIDGSVFYTHFSNKIIPDYDSNPNKIIYQNLRGHAVSQGISLNVDFNYVNRLTALIGATLMNVYQEENGERTPQYFTENFSATWNMGYRFPKANIKVDYTGNLYSPMNLPLISPTDPRKARSPWWSLQNLQLSKFMGKWEVFGGIKNLLNWTPNRGNPFIIARAHDPFDKQVQWDSNGQILNTSDNPYGLSFDPTYMYAPNQGRRYFLGLRLSIK